MAEAKPSLSAKRKQSKIIRKPVALPVNEWLERNS
jgi:hypothetical protein